MKKEVLLTPGPSQVPHRVAAAGAAPIMHHRTAEFGEIFARAVAGMKKVYGTEGDVFIIASSGSGAMEMAVVNALSPGDRVVVGNTGKFGERFAQMCRVYGVEVVELVREWGKIVTPEEMDEVLTKEKDIKAVFITYSETSTGIMHPLAELGEVIDRHGALFIVDAVSGLGGLEMKMDEWKVDMVAAGSQKALMLPPGLSFLGVRGEKAWKAVEESKIPKYYYDLKKYRKSMQKSGDTPFTIPVTLVISLDESLKMMFEEGLESIYERHKKMAAATRAGVKALGLKLFSEHLSYVETVLEVPEGMDGKKLSSLITNKYGCRVAGGQDAYKGKIVRIAHMGYVTHHDVLLAISALEMSLKELGHDFELGTGVRAAEEVFLS
ncbi:MAG: Soluble hydrogenase 42 kDa subunit [bacterium ADurb.Bin236]|nr:MAG: Soluble hydrogenase 42 kDa subunit [bacterium ADurb.Bin236]HPN95026.1 alanine--glyoxylate aminotransferase family protein [bacterium]